MVVRVTPASANQKNNVALDNARGNPLANPITKTIRSLGWIYSENPDLNPVSCESCLDCVFIYIDSCESIGIILPLTSCSFWKPFISPRRTRIPPRFCCIFRVLRGGKGAYTGSLNHAMFMQLAIYSVCITNHKSQITMPRFNILWLFRILRTNH